MCVFESVCVCVRVSMFERGGMCVCVCVSMPGLFLPLFLPIISAVYRDPNICATAGLKMDVHRRCLVTQLEGIQTIIFKHC